MRFTSGSGAEVLMGASESKSMLYLEARCIAVTRAAGAQGVQNGGIDGVNVTASVPDGMREVIAENLCVMLHDLESCTGNDTLMSASDIRRTAHTLPVLLAGTDFLFSGFGSIPAYDNAFGPSNMNAEDLDDYLVVQRDWGFEGGLRWREDARTARRPPPRRRGVPGRVRGAQPGRVHRRRRRRVRGRPRQPRCSAEPPSDLPGIASERIMDGGVTGLDVVRALVERGFETEAERVLEMIRQRLLGDVLQTSAILDEDLNVLSSLTDPNDYAGPGTGYRMSPKRRSEVARVRQVWFPEDLALEQARAEGCIDLRDLGPAQPGDAPRRGRRRRLARVRQGDLAGAERDDRGRSSAPGHGRDRGGGPAVAARPRAAVDRPRLDRLDGRPPVRLGRLGGIAGQGHGAHPPRRPAAAGQPRAVLDRPPHHLRALPRAGPQRGAVREGAGARAAAAPESSEPLGPRYHARVVQLVAIERRLAEDADPLELEAQWPI